MFVSTVPGPVTKRASARPLYYLVCAAAIAGCGGGANGSGADFAVRQTAIVVNSTADFTKRSDFPARIESTVDAALKYWGGSWAQLDGRSITFEGDRFVACGNTSSAIGCFDGNIRVSTRDVAFTYSCVEATALVHEIGHAVIGDPDHTDPRWMDFGAVIDALQTEAGGDSGCSIYPSVWRHPASAARTDAVQ